MLVTGTTGFVGGRLVPALRRAGHEGVALTRDPDRYDVPNGVRVVRGDLLRPDSLDAAFEEADAAYYLVHPMGDGGDFREIDRRAAANSRDAAERSGIDRVIYLMLLILWDVCYRIGAAWWIAVVAVWRSYRFDFDAGTAETLRRVDRTNVGFGLVQLVLVPFVLDRPLLRAALSGHVLAVLGAAELSLWYLERDGGG